MGVAVRALIKGAVAAGCCSRSTTSFLPWASGKPRGRFAQSGGGDGGGMAAGRSVRAARSCLSPLLHLNYPRFHSNRYGPLTLLFIFLGFRADYPPSPRTLEPKQTG